MKKVVTSDLENAALTAVGINIAIRIAVLTIPILLGLFLWALFVKPSSKLPECATITNVFLCPTEFQHPAFFSDMVVFDTETRQPITLIDLVNRVSNIPGVAFVRVDNPIVRSDRFFLEELASPKYEEKYTLSRAQFNELQDFVGKKLVEFSSQTAIVNHDVWKHWLEIQSGKVPFGIKLRD